MNRAIPQLWSTRNDLLADLSFTGAASGEMIPSPLLPSVPRCSNDKPKGSQNFPKSCSIPERKETKLETTFAKMVVFNSGFGFALLSGLFLKNLTKLAEVEIEACLK